LLSVTYPPLYRLKEHTGKNARAPCDHVASMLFLAACTIKKWNHTCFSKLPKKRKEIPPPLALTPPPLYHLCIEFLLGSKYDCGCYIFSIVYWCNS
jgi:hypothetical protein